MSNRVCIVGATSGIARALAHRFARDGWDLVLAGRDMEELWRIASDLSIRYQVSAEVQGFRAEESGDYGRFFLACLAGGPLAGIVVCHGYLGDQALAQRDGQETERIIRVNFTSAATLLHEAAAYFERERRGFICAISSVAGDRGRQSNYVYGAAKGGLTILLQGLRNRLYRAGVSVITVKPGFVDTGMTFGLPGMFLVASPEHVADRIYKATQRGTHTLYVPSFWALVMLIIKLVPESVFKRLRL